MARLGLASGHYAEWRREAGIDRDRAAADQMRARRIHAERVSQEAERRRQLGAGAVEAPIITATLAPVPEAHQQGAEDAAPAVILNAAVYALGQPRTVENVDVARSTIL